MRLFRLTTLTKNVAFFLLIIYYIIRKNAYFIISCTIIICREEKSVAQINEEEKVKQVFCSFKILIHFNLCNIILSYIVIFRRKIKFQNVIELWFRARSRFL